MTRINYGEGRRPIPMFATVAIILLAAVSTIFVLLITLKQPGSFGENSFNDVKQVTEGIVPGKDIILSNNVTSVFIPNGATSLSGNLSIIPLEQNLFPLAGEPGWTRPTAVKIEFQDSEGVLAPVVTFARPVLICFKLSENQWQDYTSRVSAYQVEYYAEALSLPRWEQLPIYAYPDRFQICGATNHLSVFALAVNLADGTTFSEIPNTGSQPTPNLLTSLLTSLDLYGRESDNYFLSVGPTGVLVVTTVTPPPPTDILPPSNEPPTNVPPTSEPPTSEPPTSDPPTSEPPTPVVTDPPTAVVTDPPTVVVTDPPTQVTDPPTQVTDPPATDPPATDPPATDPPATDPPATDPPSTDPPDPPADPPNDPPADPPTGGFSTSSMLIW